MPYIFVSSIGRSGTKFISEVFQAVTTYPSYHEIKPYCNGMTLIKVNERQHAPEINRKIKSIKKLRRDKQYFESSHVFLRGFSKPVLKRFREVYVIHLTRDPLETARSYVNRGSYPGSKKHPFRLPINSKRSLLHLPNKLNKFQLNLCDWLENEMRYNKMKPKFTKTYDLYHSDLNSEKVWKDLFRTFNVSYDAKKLCQVLNSDKLRQNRNYKKTQILYSDLKSGRSLMGMMKKHQIKTSIFRDKYYDKYPWIQELIRFIDGKKIPELQYFEDPPIVLQKKKRIKTKKEKKE